MSSTNAGSSSSSSRKRPNPNRPSAEQTGGVGGHGATSQTSAQEDAYSRKVRKLVHSSEDPALSHSPNATSHGTLNLPTSPSTAITTEDHAAAERPKQSNSNLRKLDRNEPHGSVSSSEKLVHSSEDSTLSHSPNATSHGMLNLTNGGQSTAITPEDHAVAKRPKQSNSSLRKLDNERLHEDAGESSSSKKRHAHSASSKAHSSLPSFFLKAKKNTYGLDVGPSTSRSRGVMKHAKIPGLTIVRNFLSRQEQRDVISFLDKQPWSTALPRLTQHYGFEYLYKSKASWPHGSSVLCLPLLDGQQCSTTLPRLTQHYGFEYLYKSKASWPQETTAIPDELDFLCDRLVERKYFAARPDQVIVNRYEPGEGIGKHTVVIPRTDIEYERVFTFDIDHKKFFGPVVASISLGDEWEMNFLLEEKGRPKVKHVVALPTGSCVVMSGEARTTWKHEISKAVHIGKGASRRRRKQRTSLTFRTLLPNPSPK